MKYKDIEIMLSEAPKYAALMYNIKTETGLVFKAESVAGVVYATKPEVAMTSMCEMIDKYLTNNV